MRPLLCRDRRWLLKRVAFFLAAVTAVTPAGVLAQTAPGSTTGDDRLAIFGQEISAVVDRAADLSVYATMCGVGREAAALRLRDAAARKIADCFKSDARAATWSADLVRQFDGKRALLRDIAQRRGKDAVCGRLYESDGKTPSAYGRDVAADGTRYAAADAPVPIAARPCP
ncbi:MAG: hypothetical protein KIT36_03875 [Alphaproteobacteria bacterium]|nr:hypothetical protein [Alphaproteobacteria bacterium]